MAEWSHKITDAQRVALRLAAQGYESKEIAPLLGVTYHAVDKRIERAVRVMGATDRKEAARMLMLEENQTYERTAYEPSDVEIPAPQAIVGVPNGIGSSDYPWPWIISRRGRRLTRSERLFWAVVGLPVIIMFTWGVFLAGIGALDQIKI
jgi:DNA-binding CsgD family transcriptional regulator